MKTLFLFLALALPCVQGNAQCNFNELLRDGQRLFSQGKYQEALKKYNAARTCDPTRGLEVDAAIEKTFVAIEQETEAARTWKKKADGIMQYFGFQTDRAWAYKNGRFAVIDRAGNRLTDFVYDQPEAFRPDGRAVALRDGLYYIVDTTGGAEGPFNYLIPTNTGLYKVKKGDQYSFLNSAYQPTGTWDWYEKIDTFHNGFARCWKGGQVGLVDSAGREVIRPQFQDLLSSNVPDYYFCAVGSEEFFGKTCKWGLVSIDRGIVLDPVYRYRFNFNHGVAVVVNDLSKHYFINLRGDSLGSLGTGDVTPYYNGLYNFKDGENWGIADTLGRIIQPAVFLGNQKLTFVDGYAVASRENDKCFVNRDGKILGAVSFATSTGFDHGYAIVDQHTGLSMIDRMGQARAMPANVTRVLAPPTYADPEPETAPTDLIYPLYRYSSDCDGIPPPPPPSMGCPPPPRIPFFLYYFRHDSYEYCNQPVRRRFLFGPALVAGNDTLLGLYDLKGKPLAKPVYSTVIPSDDHFFLVCQGKKWGLLDSTGSTVFAPQFDNVYLDNDGRFAFGGHILASRDSLWGVISTGGTIVHPFDRHLKDERFAYPFEKQIRFRMESEINLLQEGLEKTQEGGKIGFFGPDATNIPARYAAAYYFSDSVAWVSRDNRSWTIIDRRGRELFTPRFVGAHVYSFQAGVAPIELPNKKWILIDKSGQSTPVEYDSIYVFGKIDREKFDFVSDEGLILVKKNNMWGVVDSTRRVVIEPVCDEIFHYNDTWQRTRTLAYDGYIKIQKNGNWGIIDRTGATVLEPIYDDIAPSNEYEPRFCSEDIFVIKADGKWGYLSADRKVDIAPRFNKAGLFENGIAEVMIYEEEFRINTKGEIILKAP